jgi:hypothetical protein
MMMNNVRVPFLQHYRINALRALSGLAFCLLAVTSAPPTLPLVNAILEIIGAMAIFVAVAGRA